VGEHQALQGDFLSEARKLVRRGLAGDALGSLDYFRARGEPFGVHPLMRLFPPRRALGGLDDYAERVRAWDADALSAASAAANASSSASRSPASLSLPVSSRGESIAPSTHRLAGSTSPNIQRS